MGPVVLGHERSSHIKGRERFHDRYRFVCPSVCDGQRSLPIHPIIHSPTSIGAVAANVLTFRRRLKKPEPGRVESRGPGRASRLVRCGLSLTRRSFSFPSSSPRCFPPSQELFHVENCWKSPTSVERHPSLALSSHFSRTCDLAPNGHDKPSIFQPFEK